VNDETYAEAMAGRLMQDFKRELPKSTTKEKLFLTHMLTVVVGNMTAAGSCLTLAQAHMDAVAPDPGGPISRITDDLLAYIEAVKLAIDLVDADISGEEI